MNNIDNHITFNSSFPDDAVWNDNDDMVVPGGKNIIEDIRNSLKGVGYNPTEIGQHSHYGWDFEVVVAGVIFLLILQDCGPWLLIFEDRSSVISKIFYSKRIQEACTTLKEALINVLKKNEKIADVHWYTKDEYLLHNNTDQIT